MDPVTMSMGRRGRKRRGMDAQISMDCQQAKKQAVETKGKTLVGRYVKKEFEGCGVFVGKIVSYDDGLYRVDYEDGDCEDLDCAEVKDFIDEDVDLDKNLIIRKSNLDTLISKKDAKAKDVVEGATEDPEDVVEKVEGPLLSEASNDEVCEVDATESNDDGDLTSDSCDQDQDQDQDDKVNVPAVPLPELPPSSGNIGVSEEYVSYLFSVYGFLRSFSIQLYLSPFGLDDFVGSLNCHVQNTLLDAVHVALMCVLKRHIEMLSSDGSELASRCMRLMDWNLLDTMTWPVYLVQYLMIMGHISGPQWRGFYVDALEKDYYALPTGWKLMILQILCDDAIESAELRAEIDIREESEGGIDFDAVAASASETGPRRVHPRSSKTSASKNGEVVGISSESNRAKPSYDLAIKGADLIEDPDDVDDGNGDECRVCGMDGTLICCDGCPSAYHSRCIGVSKVFIPDGPWYCPECAFDRTGLTIARGTLLTGAESFGVDSHGLIFLGTCNHLLVLNLATESEPCFRYYNQNDIPKVLQTLLLSPQHVVVYSDICKAILQYWDIQKDIIISIPLTGEDEMQSGKVQNSGQCAATVLGEGHKLLDTADDKKLEGCITENCNVVVSRLENSSKESLLNKSLLDTKTETEYFSWRGSCSTSTLLASHMKSFGLSKQPKVDRTISSELDIQEAHFDSKEDIRRVVGSGDRKLIDNQSYMGTQFKPHAYVNNYIQGDFAASAAASLAVLTSEEKEVFESHAADKRRKVTSADNLLQAKAFSSAAIRFFWPNTDRKLVEVPRERCGWCFSCKASATSKKGCLLNAAASNAVKSAMKTLAGLPAAKSGDGSLWAIATYIMLMEESLCGLTVGAFRAATYRKRWCKQVEQATTCNIIKSLLLELEENIRAVALSPDWYKLVDSWLIESSAAQSAITANGSTLKRGVSGRRGRKPSVVSEPPSDDHVDNDFNWWRGGMFSKLILQRGVLPHSIVRKAARQGGRRKIPGLVYPEGSEIPKRSRRYLWRAAVEMSKNAPDLALQVRHLDHYLRWNDLVRPEQNLQDGKGQETEASAFRNAFVCDKKNMNGKTLYGVAFGSQKHLPSRVMKNIVEVEQSQGGREKYWFPETRVPLYLIKEYEQKVDKMYFPLSGKPANVLSNLQKRQLKASRKDVFSYLSCKRENIVKCSCASCRGDVMLRDAVKCSACEGFCHERCTFGSTKQSDGKVEHLMTCKLCLTKSLPHSENKESPTSPLLFQGQEFQNVVAARKGFKQKSCNQPVTPPVGRVHCALEVKSTTRDSVSVPKKRSKIASWGLILKKNRDGKTLEEKRIEDENGLSFRMRHILGKRNSDRVSEGPRCHLCYQPYNPDQMYILCKSCQNWYHTDALELEESRLCDVVGFKCCRCRRIKSPVCPYLDPAKRKILESKKKSTRGAKGGNVDSDPRTPTISDHLNELQKEEVPCTPGDDPLFYALPMEQSPELNSETDDQWNSVTTASKTGPQKLPVRRLLNNEKNPEVYTGVEQGNLMNQAQEYSLSPHVEWEVSGNCFEEGNSFDCDEIVLEDMEFEPQTYFSFNELLASDDCGQMDEANVCANDFGNTYGDVSENACGDLGNGFAVEPVICGNMGQEPEVPSETGGDTLYCRQCTHMDPIPDLCCQVCGLRIHRHCSPWVEQHPWEGQWKCGKCREWR